MQLCYIGIASLRDLYVLARMVVVFAPCGLICMAVFTRVYICMAALCVYTLSMSHTCMYTLHMHQLVNFMELCMVHRVGMLGEE